MPKASSPHKALAAILPLIASDQPYEAHQKARTFASRYTKAGQNDTAIDVLFQSARKLFKVSQHGSGTDLTIFLIEVYENAGVPVDEESRGLSFVMRERFLFTMTISFKLGRITQLLALVGPEGSWRKTIINKSIQYVCLIKFRDIYQQIHLLKLVYEMWRSSCWRSGIALLYRRTTFQR
jgi:hypothetical protein